MRTSSTRRAVALAHAFNFLAALYFLVIAIVGLVQLRWYHQLTVAAKVRHLATATSYLAFIILIVTSVLLTGLFVAQVLYMSPKRYMSGIPGGGGGGNSPSVAPLPEELLPSPPPETSKTRNQSTNGCISGSIEQEPASTSTQEATNIINHHHHHHHGSVLIFQDSTEHKPTNLRVCCSTLLHLISSLCLLIVLVVWQTNSGELVRDSISSQLEEPFRKYQYFNRSNYYSVTIDGMQDINKCCGTLDYNDFPRRLSGLSSGHYPGSCCGKSIFGANARVFCSSEEVQHARQTTGCVLVLTNYYDLLSILIVPIALVCLFVNIVIIALITTTKVQTSSRNNGRPSMADRDRHRESRFELRTPTTGQATLVSGTSQAA